MTEGDIRANLSRNIKAFRQRQNMSQADLAEKADISIPFLSQIECANKFPSPVILARLADSLHASVSELFAGVRGYRRLQNPDRGDEIHPERSAPVIRELLQELLRGGSCLTGTASRP